MEHRKDEEEYLYKIKKSIYQSNEVDSPKQTRPFRKKALPIVVVLACTFLFLLFNNLGLMIINHRYKVVLKLSLKQKMSLLKIHH